jgi:hypothetical protein
MTGDHHHPGPVDKAPSREPRCVPAVHDADSSAQLAAVSFPARQAGRIHALDAFHLMELGVLDATGQLAEVDLSGSTHAPTPALLEALFESDEPCTRRESQWQATPRRGQPLTG